jgi:intracellular multiplication protein IcmE
MTNNDQESDDLDMGEGADDEASSFDDFEGSKEKGKAFSGPVAKIGIIAAAVVAVLAIIILFGGEEKKIDASAVAPVDKVDAVPGTGELSPAMKEALINRNEQEAENAARTGTSAMPMQVETPDSRLSLPGDEGAQEEDPLERWRKIQEERQKRESGAQRPEPPPVNPHAEAINTLAKSMAKQMQAVLDAQEPVAAQVETIASSDYLEDQREKEKQKKEEEAAKAGTSTTVDPIILDIIQPAGTIEYAQLITEANSDAPGPVLAQIASGPLAGARILGQFEVKEEYLTLSFNTVVVDGISYGMNGVALDPATANPGIVTEIDRRYFSRVILPAAAAFVEGMGSAIAESGTTTVTVKGETVATEEEDLNTEQEIYKGVEEAAGKMSEIIDEEAGKIQPMLKIHAGTPISILFMEPVTKDKK